MVLMDTRQRSTMLPAAPGFGAWLRDTRDTQALSLRALACLMACNAATLSRIERSQRRPCRETAIALVDTLGVFGAERIEALSLAGFIERPLNNEQALILATWDDVIAAD